MKYTFEQNGYVFRDKICGFNQWALIIITFNWLWSNCLRTHYIRFTLARVYARTHLPQDMWYKFFLFFWSNCQWFLKTTCLRYLIQVALTWNKSKILKAKFIETSDNPTLGLASLIYWIYFIWFRLSSWRASSSNCPLVKINSSF